MPAVDTGLSPKMDEAFTRFLEKNKQELFRFRTTDYNQYSMPVQQRDGQVTPKPQSPSYCLAGVEDVRAPEGHQVELMYSRSKQRENVGGQIMLVPVPEAIWFDARQHCQIEVPRRERELLTRLLFSVKCRNNLNEPNEEPAGGYAFELIQPERNAAQLADLKRLTGRALAKLEEASAQEMAVACERLELPTSADQNVNYTTLFDLASQEPQRVLTALGDEYDKHAAFVRELLQVGVVEFDQATRSFLVLPERTVLLVVPQGQQEQALIKYLIENPEGKKVKPSLKKKLEAKTPKR